MPVGDAISLASALETALREPIAADSLRSRADDFSVEQAVDHYLRLIPEQAAG
ncbi:MAG: hypothetical protein HC838_08485 [Spirulinaceae cyanobacterium RM2_2_10]|nr:hypothetical protein [Spirulinaceae cyanobacterium RM2_2_10]